MVWESSRQLRITAAHVSNHKRLRSTITRHLGLQSQDTSVYNRDFRIVFIFSMTYIDTLAPGLSRAGRFGTCHHIGTSMIRDCTTTPFQFTMYRQFARKVGTSANSALIRYYLLRLKLSSSTRDRVTRSNSC